MTNDEFRAQLAALPHRLLRRMARGRTSRPFRMGKPRLVQTLLALPPEPRAHVEAELAALRREAAAAPPTPGTPPAGASEKRGRRPQHGRASTATPAAGTPAEHGQRTSAPRPSSHATAEAPAVTIGALLEDIGVPPPQTFVPDPWQIEAVDSLATGSVILSVPTGSGKTYVAVEAMRRAIAAGHTVIYTSPLKALSNTKLTEFAQIFGAENVGILTGDRRDNPRAPVLIMTTEILRNLLYDAGGGDIDMRLDTLGLVILDESQFIADPERGVVWEETIIFCPAQARLLLLSASIGNPDEVAAWITSIRSTPCHLIHHRNRSVPLRAAYLDPSRTLTPLFRTRDIIPNRAATLHPETTRLFAQYETQTLGPRS